MLKLLRFRGNDRGTAKPPVNTTGTEHMPLQEAISALHMQEHEQLMEALLNQDTTYERFSSIHAKVHLRLMQLKNMQGAAAN